MKIKNLAFFGVMAAIMGVAGTARADTTTIIASQAYVDAKDALKQNLLNSATGGNVVVSGTGNVVTGITADGQGTVTVTKGNLDLTDAVSDLDLADGDATGTGNVVKSVTQTDGQIAVTKGEIVNADVASNAAIDDSKIAFTTAHTNALDSGITSTKVSNYENTKTTVDNATDDNVVATRSDNTNLLKGTGLQKAVAHLKGNGAEKYTAHVDNSDTENTGIKNRVVNEAAKTAWDATLTAKKGDDYLTTLAAVERRVQEGVQDAVSQAGNNVTAQIGSDTKSATTNNMVTSVTTTNGVVTAVGSAQVTDDYVATDAGIASTKLTVGTGYNASTATGDVSTSDSVQSALAKIEHKANNAGTAAINGLDVTDNATTQPVVAVNQTDGTVSSVRGTITYTDALESKLSNVNATGDEASAFKNCTTASPCTLTMIWSGDKPVYEWTNMDTENTNATL